MFKDSHVRFTAYCCVHGSKTWLITDSGAGNKSITAIAEDTVTIVQPRGSGGQQWSHKQLQVPRRNYGTLWPAWGTRPILLYLINYRQCRSRLRPDIEQASTVSRPGSDDRLLTYCFSAAKRLNIINLWTHIYMFYLLFKSKNPLNQTLKHCWPPFF